MVFQNSLIVTIIVNLLFILSTSAQTGTISGFVFDESNGETLIGANIYIQNTNLGSVTNNSGYYVLKNIPPGDHEIICSYIGYADYKEKIAITDGIAVELNIKMKTAALETESIVVVADSVRTAVKLFKKAISNIRLSPMEIKQMPAVAETDLLRTLQNLPGILPISDFSSKIYVRGGTSDQNLFLVDGADVYNPEHAFGLFSTFNTDAIKDVNISKGGFGAVYGGRLSSIIDVTNLDGNRNEFEGSAEISLLSAKLTIQTPLGNLGSLSGSFRRTYLNETIKPFMEDIPDYYFYDGHLKTYLDLNPYNKLSISFYNGRDVLGYVFNKDSEDSETIDYCWGNTAASLRWTHVFSPGFFSNFWITYSLFNSDFAFSEISENNDLTDLSFKAHFEYYLSQKIQFIFGIENKNIKTIYEQDSKSSIINIESSRRQYDGYGQLTWTPFPGLVIEPGLRYTFFKADRDFQDLSPRLAFKYRLTETINVKASTGIYNQYLNKIPRPFVADIWTSADKNYYRSTANHYIVGLQKEIGENLEFEVEGYYKTYNNLYTLKNYFLDFEPQSYDHQGRPVYSNTNGLFNRGDGRSLGLEFLFRKKFGALSGWFAYSIANTEFLIDEINKNENFVPRHDRTHVINAVWNVDIKSFIRDLRDEPYRNERSKWLFGMNFTYSSGQPITLTSSTYLMGSTPDQEDKLLLYPSAINGFRLPAYIRLDLSVTYQKFYKSWSMAPYIQIINIGNRENIWFIQYENEEKNNTIVQTIDTFNMFPLLPTLGIRFKF